MRINLFLNKKDLRNSDLFPAIMDYFRRIDKFVKINIYYCLNSMLRLLQCPVNIGFKGFSPVTKGRNRHKSLLRL